MRFVGLMTSGNTGDFGGNLNEIHGQSLDKLQEYPTRGKSCNSFGSCLSVYREAFTLDKK